MLMDCAMSGALKKFGGYYYLLIQRNMEKEQIRFLENIAADGFVGLEEIVYDGWELRFTYLSSGDAE